MTQWLKDLGGETFAHSYRLDEILFDDHSPYQHVQVACNELFGTMLILDDAVQTTTADEFIYHEMLAHVPLVAHPKPRSLLIIGGGDGGLLEEGLKHPLDRAVMVEIDRMVVDVTLRYLPGIPGKAFEDPRADLRIEDGFAYVRNVPAKFDVVLVDSTDPKGPSVPLFGEAFYGDLAQAMSDDGILAVQSGSPWYQRDLIAQVRAGLRKHFPIVRTYVGLVPTYPGVYWSFSIGSKRHDPATVADAAIAARTASFDLRYYDAAQHRAAFSGPAFLRPVLDT